MFGQIQILLWVALGSALGGAARYGMALWATNRLGDTFPWGTLMVNVLGSFLIGLAAQLVLSDGRLLLGTSGRAFVLVGLLGGFTTFSAFSLQTLMLMRDGEWLRAGANSAFSLMLCLAAVYLGHLAAGGINSLRS